MAQGQVSTDHYSTPMSLSPAHRPRGLTLFCWILNESDRPFRIDIEDDVTVSHLKHAIVKRKPLLLQDVDPDDLDLWKVSGFPSFSTYADNLPARHPFRLTGNSRTMLEINSFLKMTRYWRETSWRRFIHHLVPLRRCFTSLYDIRVVSHLFDHLYS